MAIVRLRPFELKHALETGALTLHYQPQVEIKSGRLAGVEAFVRWPHPVHGMIGPSDIVPLIDQAGLHVEFDRWVIGAISRLNRPSAMARPARSWLPAENSSSSSRLRPHCSAIISAESPCGMML